MALLFLVSISGCADPQPAGDRSDPRLTTEQYSLGLSKCLTELGWDASITEQGDVEVSVPTEDEDQYSGDVEKCREQIGANRPLSFSESEMDALYEMYLDNLKCLEGQGITLPPPPSLDVYRSSAVGTYYSFKDIPATVLNQRGNALAVKCPPERLSE